MNARRTITLPLYAWILTSACGGKGQDAAPDAAPPAAVKPVEAAPFTLTYSYTAAGAKEPLAIVILASDGAVSAIEDKPAKRFVGTLDADKIASLSKLIADPELRALKSTDEKAAGATVRLELVDAKGALWNLRVAGAESPPEMRGLRAFIDGVQADLKGEKRPPPIIAIDVTHTSTAKGAPPKERVRIMANTLVMVWSDDKPSAYGNVAVADVETLRVGSAAVEASKDKPGTSGDVRVVRFERDEGDGGPLERSYDGDAPLAVGALLVRVDDMKAQAKPLIPFDTVTYEFQATSPKKGPLEVLTIDATGKLALTADGKPVATGQAADQELFNVYSTLGAIEKAESAKPGPGEPIIAVKVAGKGGAHEVRFGEEVPGGMARAMANLDKLKAQLAPAPAPAPGTAPPKAVP